MRELPNADEAMFLSNPGNTVGKVIIVHSNNKVKIINTDGVEKESLTRAVIQELGTYIEAKEISFIGGTLLSNTRQADGSQ